MPTPNTATPPAAAAPSPRACIFVPDPDAADYQPALTLGQGLPMQIGKEPVDYQWKEVLGPRNFAARDGTPHSIKPERIDNLLSNFQKLMGKGRKPPLPTHHPKDGEPKDALRNLGYAVDARKNDKGKLEVLCQLIGTDAIRASARNYASIGTVLDYIDDDGQAYDEVIDHVAIVPDPRLTDLEGFKPALAASNGPALAAVVLTPAAEPTPATPARSDPMQLKELRTALKLADTTPDEQVISKAVETLGKAPEPPPKIEDSEPYKAVLKRATDAEAQALQLSNSTRQADPEILNDRLGTFSDKLDVLADKNHCTPEQKKAALEIVAPGGKPSPLMLSQSIATGPASAVLKLLELQNTNPFGRHTAAQPVARQTPGDNGAADPMAEGRAIGDAYQKQQLAARGVTSAA